MRKSDRIMKLGVESLVLNVVCAYAPQVGCTEEEKKFFWRHLDEILQTVLQEERIFVGEDLNGHINSEKGVVSRIHGGWGVEGRIESSESSAPTLKEHP
ncbi:hypothetical protein Pmani_008849 [Petrolisthes manimaculis]|uniref:Craniofacial development protein 2-like n=1 Tax=Petrolisthes manimaculis TaxID=1843537 RepID=A0AAE1Q5H7_9EUCA|nr:hypothetical protein Pmani_008849 [Petrolisthes manimaculis]